MLHLRPYRPADAEAIVRWVTDERTFYRWSAGRHGAFPPTAQRLKDDYAAAQESDRFYVWTAYDEQGAAGHLITRFTGEDTLRLGFVLVDDQRRGLGYGKELVRLALCYAFEVLLVARVTIGVFDDNLPAIHCYRSVGFRDSVPPVTEQFEAMGEVWTCFDLEITREMWQK